MTAVLATRNSTIVRTEIPRVRPLEPVDVPLIDAMSAELSGRSLAQRFFAGTPCIPRAMLRQLAQLDHVTHEAVVAEVDTRVVGLAQYVRDAEMADHAELAVLVVDRWQFKGVGRQLVTTLARLAVSRGITHFEADVLADNAPARHMIAAGWPAVRPVRDGDCLHFVLPLLGVLAL